jgi:hypothetical protein
MNISGYGVFLSLAETLKWSGWEIVKFKDLGGGAKLTVIPVKDEKKGAEA